MNTSTGAVSYYWDMGNGNTSTLPNPSNLYTTSGNFTVFLIAIDGSGVRDTARYVNYINASPHPSANFYATSTTSCLDNNSFHFISTSTGAVSYLWDFGDGIFSTLQNPVHSYTLSGQFTVTLIVSNALGCSDQEIFNQYITIYPKPDPTISSNATSSCDPSTVFNFTSSATDVTSWHWNFGDGNTSNLQNPSHAYATGGSFPVTLIVTNSYGCRDTSSVPLMIHVGSSSWVSFNSNTDFGCAPLNVSFTNTTANAVSLLWNFGDGGTSTLPNPVHDYILPGTYNVTLSLTTSSGCSGQIIRNNYIRVGDNPIPDFSFSASQGCSPISVQFTNLSSFYDSCLWNFGDGFTSTQTNPTHLYTGSGTFNISLQCWNSFGCSKTKIIQNALSVSRDKALFSASPRIGCPPLTVNFANFSMGNQLTYFWDFGDGNTSTQQIPTHTYISIGSFNVKLIVTDSSGCSDTLYKPTYIQTINPSANYVPPPVTGGCAPMTAQFTDQTQGSISWLWNFGDGDTATQQNPIHIYLLPGTYVVSLTTISVGGGCTQTINNFSTFEVHGGYAGFIHTDSQCPPYQSCFHDTSYHAISWFWDFGDGNFSTLQNPCHTYSAPGYHSVSLTITTSDGCTYTTMQSNSVYFAPFGANFYGIQQTSTYPMEVDFHANSTGAIGWLWDFGDSTTSTQENPIHIYQDSGNYLVTLIITSDLCTLTYVHPAVQTGQPDTVGILTGNPGLPEVQKGCTPLNVNFSQIIHGSVAWHWDFGDGDTSNVEFPNHLYTNPGIYNVSLTTWDTLGLESDLQMDSIVRVFGPQANFGFGQQSACLNTQISLHDSSTNAYHWYWDFGDGNYSTQQNPVHIYSDDLPNYMVTLTVTDTAGCTSSLSTSIFANFISPIIASETDICGYDTVRFSTSLQNYVSYFWNFGDSTTSSQQNPAHLYTTEGSFPAYLTTTDYSGCVQTFSVNPNITVHLPKADFTLNDRHSCDTLNTTFTNTSLNAEGYFWTFGDGATSTLANPSHTYLPGIYNVTLTGYDNGCVDIHTLPQAVKVDTAHADFNETINGTCLPIITTFTDLSINAVSWKWYFGTPASDSSEASNPIFTYYHYYNFPIRLSVIDSNGCKATVIKSAPAATIATFTNSTDSGCVPVTIHFTCTTNSAMAAGGVFWDFGDGNTSTVFSPAHTYTVAGNYSVMLVVNSGPQFGNCTDTLIKPALIKVHQPHANFSSPDLYACAPSIVHFTDSSLQTDSYLWNFGDSSTSTDPNPSHIYTTPGIYSVSLVAISDMGCSDSIVKPLYITVLGPVTHFSATATEGCVPINVNFTDESENAVDWTWNYGDGYSAFTENSSHTYNDTGSFTVTLVTHDTASCSSYYELPQKIIIHSNPVAAFSIPTTMGCMTDAVPFINISQGAQNVLWNFDDGFTSTDFNPSHIYSMPGNYYPSLVVTNQFGCTDSIRSTVPIQILATAQVSATSSVSQGCSPLVANFTSNVTYIDSATWFWDFGNGITSTQPNPTIVFTTPGIYIVTLTVTNANGCGGTVTLPSIQVSDSLPPPESRILSVSVASNTSVKITWENNPAIDLNAYLIYRLNLFTNQYEIIHSDTNVHNINFSINPTYTDTGLNTLHNVYTYKLQANDACQNAIPLSKLTAHSTINVETERLGQGITVNWNAYGGCPVSSYIIYRSMPGNEWQYLTSVSPATLNYLDTTLDCPIGYAYRITATDLCGNSYISNSDTSVTIPLNIFENQIVDVVRSTVVDNQTILTEWMPPVVHPEKVIQFDLYRSTDNINFSFLNSLSPMQNDYMDNDVDVQNTHYYYKILVVNTCDIAEALSGNTSTIVLKSTENEDYNIHIFWTPYRGWDTGVDYYIIEKKEEGGNWEFLKKVDGETLDYIYHE
jgi:PKD repeat protein